MGKRGSLVFIGAAVVCAAAPLTDCLDATEIVLQISTDVSCTIVQGTDVIAGTKVLIRVGSPSNITQNPPTRIESSECTPGDATSSSTNDLGTISVLPSGGFNDAISITVALSNDPATPTSACFPEATGPASCIYAHRQLSFLPHALVTLPIVLSSRCAGNTTCIAPQTCDPDTGQCTDGHVNVDDCGTACSGSDAGKSDGVTTIDSPTFDVVVFDSPSDVKPDVTTCDAGSTFCNGKCVDLMIDPNNCGGCGVDCTGTANGCNNGTCTIDLQAKGSCLAVNNGKVFVATSLGVYTYPSNGGSGGPYNSSTDQIVAMASMPSHVAWFGISSNLASVFDQSSNQQYGENLATQTALMALDGSAFAWFDHKQNRIVVQPNQLVAATLFPVMSVTDSIVPIAMGAKYVYTSLPAEGQLVYSDNNANNVVNNVTSPGAIIVDDPTKVAPNVYDVEKSAVIQRDYQLANAKPYASSGTAITSIVWDGSKVIANATSMISYAQGSSFVKIVAATPAPKCIAVDSNAVYWLDATAGLYKHAKP